MAVEQHGQLGVQLALAIQRRCHGVEFQCCMQAQPGHGVAPFIGAVGGGVDEIQYRQQGAAAGRSEEHTSELQSLMRISYAVFCLKKKKQLDQTTTNARRQRTTE